MGSTVKTVLAGDVGGTNVRLALYEGPVAARLDGGRPRLVAQQNFRGDDYPVFEEILAAFLKEQKRQPDLMSLGVAGPVTQGQAKITNRPWTVRSAELERRFGVRAAYLINDLEAHAYGIPLLREEHLVCLQRGREQQGNQALIAAGTGLGECLLFWDGQRHRPSPSEGSHASFGPCTPREIELLRFLLRRHEHVSWERVVSGALGFRSLFDFVRSTGDHPQEAGAKLESAAELGPAIQAAADARDPVAVDVMRLFARLYGAEAGNLALKALAVGGVYVGGGIAPKILPWLEEGSFLEAFAAKGRFRGLLSEIPVRVILDPDLSLKGAARHALLQQSS